MHSGRIAQKRYVFAWSIVSLRYLQRKYELQPGMETPGLSFFFLNASAWRGEMAHFFHRLSGVNMSGGGRSHLRMSRRRRDMR